MPQHRKEVKRKEQRENEGWMVSFIWSRITTGCLAKAIVPVLWSRHVKILAAKPAVLPAVRILVIPAEETNDPGGQANKISFRSPMLSDSFVGRKERRRVCQLRSYVHQVRTLEVLLKAVRRRWNETNASRRRHIL